MAAPRHAQKVSTTEVFSSGVAVDLSAADVVLADPCRGFYAGAGGNITVRLAGDSGSGGSDVLLTSTLVGRVYWLRVAIFRKTGTAATGIVALY